MSVVGDWLSYYIYIQLIMVGAIYNVILELYTVKPVLSGHSRRRPKLAFKTDYCLMQVKSIAECSKRAFCNTFDLH